jgi:hypothetical protein
MIAENCEDCKLKRCKYASMFENLLFCFSRQKTKDYFAFDNEDEHQFILTPKNLFFNVSDIQVCSYNVKADRLSFYFYEIIIDAGLLKRYVSQLYGLIGYDPKKAIIDKPKVTDVHSFLSKRELMSMTIDYAIIDKLRQHDILCMGFGPYG